MKYENRNYSYKMTDSKITRQDLENGEILTLDNPSKLSTITALKNLKSVFDMQSKHPEAFKAINKALADSTGDKVVLAKKLLGLATQKQFAPYTRATADGSLMLQYGIYIWLGIPHSTLSVSNCKEGKLNHTGDSIASYSEKSDFITLDKSFYQQLLAKENEVVTDEVVTKTAKAPKAPSKASKHRGGEVTVTQLTPEQLAEITANA